MVTDLDRLRAAHVVAEQWLLAVDNRLEGAALYLLSDELCEQAEINRQAGAALADRVAELDGAVTGDPTTLVELSKLAPFELPADTSEPAAITRQALERVRGMIGAYAETLDRTREADELTHRLLLKLVRQQVETEADLGRHTRRLKNAGVPSSIASRSYSVRLRSTNARGDSHMTETLATTAEHAPADPPFVRHPRVISIPLPLVSRRGARA